MYQVQWLLYIFMCLFTFDFNRLSEINYNFLSTHFTFTFLNVYLVTIVYQKKKTIIQGKRVEL